jgi:hypothetical protein
MPLLLIIPLPVSTVLVSTWNRRRITIVQIHHSVDLAVSITGISIVR